MKWKITILFITVVATSYAQSPPQQEIDIQSFIEDLFATQEVDGDYADLYESLFVLYTDPIDLNKTSKEELKSLNLLNENQINSLLNHISKNGKLLSLYELQSISGYDVNTINALLPFVKIGDANAIDNRILWQRIKEEENNYLIVRYEQTLQRRRGFTPINEGDSNRYLGDEGKYYMRFRTSHINDFSLGFTLEKDAGEEFRWDRSSQTYGSDFQSFHAMVQNKGIVKSAVIGDYQLQIGQGLLTSAGFAIGKGGETINTVRRNHLGLRPYTSVVESGFYRGGALTIEKGRFEITPFYSRLRRDAIVRSDTIETEQFITSLQTSGFHRTESELKAKGTILEQVIGGNISYLSQNKNLRISATGLHTSLDVPIEVTPRFYNQFNFSSDQNTILGASANYQYQNINTFFEAGRSQNGGYGILGGLITSLTPKLDWALLIRNYTRDFQSLYGNAFGENTRNQNERGIYWGFKYKYSRRLTFSAYYDKFSFPWLRSSTKAPSDGYEYLVRVQYKPQKTVNLYVQFREEEKSRNVNSEENSIDFVKAGVKRNLVLNADYVSMKNLSMKTRFQMSQYELNGTTTKGSALIQGITYKYRKWTISGRYALFDTDDFENRQYVYEKDVLYAFSIPAYNGLGARQYLLLQYKYNRKISLWMRYSVTQFRDRKKIGSGLQEIEGNKVSAIKLQARIKF